jgi:hypothetical protein
VVVPGCVAIARPETLQWATALAAKHKPKTALRHMKAINGVQEHQPLNRSTMPALAGSCSITANLHAHAPELHHNTYCCSHCWQHHASSRRLRPLVAPPHLTIPHRSPSKAHNAGLPNQSVFAWLGYTKQAMLPCAPLTGKHQSTATNAARILPDCT